MRSNSLLKERSLLWANRLDSATNDKSFQGSQQSFREAVGQLAPSREMTMTQTINYGMIEIPKKWRHRTFCCLRGRLSGILPGSHKMPASYSQRSKLLPKTSATGNKTLRATDCYRIAYLARILQSKWCQTIHTGCKITSKTLELAIVNRILHAWQEFHI